MNHAALMRVVQRVADLAEQPQALVQFPAG